MEKKIALILSGGGMKGVSYLGFIKALEESDIQISHITAFSGGALAAVAHGLNINYEEVKKIVNNLSMWKILDKSLIGKKGILDENNIWENLKELVGDAEFSDLKTKTIILASNLERRRLDIFDRGKIIGFLRASISITPIIPPFIIEGNEYYDAGFLTIFPTQITKHYTTDRIIGLVPSMQGARLFGSLLSRVKYIDLMLDNYYSLLASIERPDMVFETLPSQSGGLFSFGMIDQFYEEGYNEGRKAAEKIEKMLDQ